MKQGKFLTFDFKNSILQWLVYDDWEWMFCSLFISSFFFGILNESYFCCCSHQQFLMKKKRKTLFLLSRWEKIIKAYLYAIIFFFDALDETLMEQHVTIHSPTLFLKLDLLWRLLSFACSRRFLQIGVQQRETFLRRLRKCPCGPKIKLN